MTSYAGLFYLETPASPSSWLTRRRRPATTPPSLPPLQRQASVQKAHNIQQSNQYLWLTLVKSTQLRFRQQGYPEPGNVGDRWQNPPNPCLQTPDSQAAKILHRCYPTSNPPNPPDRDHSLFLPRPFQLSKQASKNPSRPDPHTNYRKTLLDLKYPQQIAFQKCHPYSKTLTQETLESRAQDSRIQDLWCQASKVQLATLLESWVLSTSLFSQENNLRHSDHHQHWLG